MCRVRYILFLKIKVIIIKTNCERLIWAKLLEIKRGQKNIYYIGVGRGGTLHRPRYRGLNLFSWSGGIVSSVLSATLF